MATNPKAPIITSISSGKGGVGKTFITINLAACLARKGKKVLVVDCDLGLANIDIMIGVHPKCTLRDVIFGDLDVSDVAMNTRCGFDLVPASSGVKEMAQLLYENIGRIKSALGDLGRNYDHVVLDNGAGISENVLEFNRLANRNVIVLNKEVTSLADAYATIKVIHQMFGRDSFDIIVNSVTDADEAKKIFDHIDSICRRFLGISLRCLGHVTQDEAVPRSILKQEVLVNLFAESQPAIDCQRIAERIAYPDRQSTSTSP
jgi:flagellar biosynthesis protein FlhG